MTCVHDMTSQGDGQYAVLGRCDSWMLRRAGPRSDANEGDHGSDWGDEAAVLDDADSLSEWGATDDGTSSRPGSAAPSPDRRPSAPAAHTLLWSRRMPSHCTHPTVRSQSCYVRQCAG